METLHVMVREAVEQIPPRRLLRDEDRDAIRRHQEWLLTLGPEVAQALKEVLYSRLSEGAEPSQEDLERWWGRTVTGPWDDDYLVWMAFIGLVHVTRGAANPMMLAASDHVVQLVADALVRSEIPDEGRRHRTGGHRVESRACGQRCPVRGCRDAGGAAGKAA